MGRANTVAQLRINPRVFGRWQVADLNEFLETVRSLGNVSKGPPTMTNKISEPTLRNRCATGRGGGHITDLPQTAPNPSYRPGYQLTDFDAIRRARMHLQEIDVLRLGELPQQFDS